LSVTCSSRTAFGITNTLGSRSRSQCHLAGVAPCSAAI
jgi:hypothetical protein